MQQNDHNVCSIADPLTLFIRNNNIPPNTSLCSPSFIFFWAELRLSFSISLHKPGKASHSILTASRVNPGLSVTRKNHIRGFLHNLPPCKQHVFSNPNTKKICTGDFTTAGEVIYCIGQASGKCVYAHTVWAATETWCWQTSYQAAFHTIIRFKKKSNFSTLREWVIKSLMEGKRVLHLENTNNMNLNWKVDCIVWTFLWLVLFSTIRCNTKLRRVANVKAEQCRSEEGNNTLESYKSIVQKHPLWFQVVKWKHNSHLITHISWQMKLIPRKKFTVQHSLANVQTSTTTSQNAFKHFA